MRNLLLVALMLLPYMVFAQNTKISGNRVETSWDSLSSSFTEDSSNVFVFDNNNLRLPIDAKGNIGYGPTIGPTGEVIRGSWFDEGRFLWSSGFALSGYSNGTLWGNGMLHSIKLQDYTEGLVDSTQISGGLYIIRSSQPDFSQSWHSWKDAVKQGADFYDGNGDGVYDPVDLNENGVWDTNEDKPDIIGDITTWCVFNDGVPIDERYYNVEPQGIEIRQSVFSYNKEDNTKLSNVIFVKYNIQYLGTATNKLDTVYFSIFSDGEIGGGTDDLFGSDTTTGSIFQYNDSTDRQYGNNPPSTFLTLLQGPASFIPGETFIDNNSNGKYDEGIDTPIDTATAMNGELIGTEIQLGAKNQKMSSSVALIEASFRLLQPYDKIILRYYMEGKDMDGNFLDPCNWDIGTVYNSDCSTINPKYFYSGDPRSLTGWINRLPYDQRSLNTTGPFVLEKEKPIDIVVAYIVGRGTDALNSITEARNIAKDAIGFYNTNFSFVPVGVKKVTENSLPTEFSLSQNYPNPFNPSTTIKYSIPNVGNENFRSVQLKIYDILGREVATLVNKQQKAGNYEITFNASNLTSGIYFYRLQSGSFTESKKMILLK